MNPFLLGGALGLLVLGILLEEAAAWFGRHALDLLEEEGGGEPVLRDARRARQARLLGRFAAAMAFTLGALAVGTDRAAGGILLGTAFLAAILAAPLAAVRWRSPLTLAGRAVYMPLRVPARFLRGFLLLLGRLPGFGAPSGSLARLAELDQERTWVLGRTFEDEQGKVLSALHEFGESRVEDVMAPREEIAGLAAETALPGIVAAVEKEGYARYPVYQGSLDTVVGILHVFDLLDAPPEATAGSLSREPYFTNATKPVGALLRELQATYNQMAVVVDEYGGTAGIVTVEDLLEELVGDIEDEEDVEETSLKRLEPGVYWVAASLRIDELNEALGLELEEGEYDTVAGLVLERLERIPRPGERIDENGVRIEVASAEPHRIDAVRLTLLGKATAGKRSASREEA